MEFVLVRHGEPEWVRDGLNVVDPPLTERGHAQARQLAAALATEQFDEVLVSPLQRARQTAAPLYDALGREEIIEPWLEEIRDPMWHGTPAEKAAEAYKELRDRVPHERWDGLPGGESVREFVARIRTASEKFLAERGVHRADDELPVWHIEDPQRKLGLIAHSGTNSVTICQLLGLEPTPWEWDRFVIGHASVSRLVALPMGGVYTFSMTLLSDVQHLDAEHRTH